MTKSQETYLAKLMGIQKYLTPDYLATIFIDKNKLNGIHFSIEIQKVDSKLKKDHYVLKHIRDMDDLDKNVKRIDNFRKFLEEKGIIDFSQKLDNEKQPEEQKLIEKSHSKHLNKQLKENEERRKSQVSDSESPRRMGENKKNSGRHSERQSRDVVHMRKTSNGTSRKSLSKIPRQSGLNDGRKIKTPATINDLKSKFTVKPLKNTKNGRNKETKGESGGE